MGRKFCQSVLLMSVGALVLWINSDVVMAEDRTKSFSWLGFPFWFFIAALLIKTCLPILNSLSVDLQPPNKLAFFANAAEKTAPRLAMLALASLVLIVLIARQVDPNYCLGTPFPQFMALFVQHIGSR